MQVKKVIKLSQKSSSLLQNTLRNAGVFNKAKQQQPKTQKDELYKEIRSLYTPSQSHAVYQHPVVSKQVRQFNSMSAEAVEESDQMITRFVTSQLKQGEVTIWTEGESSRLNGRQTLKVKKILTNHQIPFREIDISVSPWEECTAIGLEMHTGQV